VVWRDQLEAVRIGVWRPVERVDLCGEKEVMRTDLAIGMVGQDLGVGLAFGSCAPPRSRVERPQEARL
jgi:hypothetical protein